MGHGGGKPLGVHFLSFYMKRSVLGNKIWAFLMILMSILSEFNIHLILVLPKFIQMVFTPRKNFQNVYNIEYNIEFV